MSSAGLNLTVSSGCYHKTMGGISPSPDESDRRQEPECCVGGNAITDLAVHPFLVFHTLSINWTPSQRFALYTCGKMDIVAPHRVDRDKGLCAVVAAATRPPDTEEETV